MTTSGPPVDPRAQALRLPPQNEEAEQGLLGTILHANAAYDLVADFLEPEHFADPVHGRIYAACAKLIEAGQLADVVVLRNQFEQEGELAAVGGAEYLGQLVAALVSTTNAGEYGRIVYDCYLRRELIDVGEGTTNAAHAFEETQDGVDILEAAEARLSDLGGRGRAGFQPRRLAHVTDEVLEKLEATAQGRQQATGTRTGIAAVDRIVGSLKPGTVSVIGGATSMGKSAMGCSIALNVAARGEPVLLLSYEMKNDQVTHRFLAHMAKVAVNRISEAAWGHVPLPTDDLTRVCDAGMQLRTMPLVLLDDPTLTVPGIRAQVRRLDRQFAALGGLRLVVIDYLNLLPPVGGGRRSATRTQEIDEISHAVKRMARILQVPVLVMAQVNRQVDTRPDHRPHLGDLRESGAIEQDADLVMLLYRHEYYLAREQKKGDHTRDAEHDEWLGKAELLVPKNRQGPTNRWGDLLLRFTGQETWFADWDEPRPEQEGHLQHEIPM